MIQVCPAMRSNVSSCPDRTCIRLANAWILRLDPSSVEPFLPSCRRAQTRPIPLRFVCARHCGFGERPGGRWLRKWGFRRTLSRTGQRDATALAGATQPRLPVSLTSTSPCSRRRPEMHAPNPGLAARRTRTRGEMTAATQMPKSSSLSLRPLRRELRPRCFSAPLSASRRSSQRRGCTSMASTPGARWTRRPNTERYLLVAGPHRTAHEMTSRAW